VLGKLFVELVEEEHRHVVRTADRYGLGPGLDRARDHDRDG